jgi:hypothetical protein
MVHKATGGANALKFRAENRPARGYRIRWRFRTNKRATAQIRRHLNSDGAQPMKVGKNKLRMSSGEVRSFKSEKARDNFERVAKAVKHGFKPTGKKKGKK